MLFKDPSCKQDQWLWGVFFYGQAVSTSIVSFFIYFVPYNQYLSNMPNDNKLIDDMDLVIRVFNDKEIKNPSVR